MKQAHIKITKISIKTENMKKSSFKILVDK